MKHGWKIPQQYFDHFLRNFPCQPCSVTALRAQLLYKGGNLCHPCDGAGDVQCAGGFWDSGEIVVGTVAHAWNGSEKKTKGSGQNQAISLDKFYVYCWSVLLHGCMRNHEDIYIEFNWCTSYIHTDAGIIKAKKKDTMEIHGDNSKHWIKMPRRKSVGIIDSKQNGTNGT